MAPIVQRNPDALVQAPALVLMRDMGITDADIERRARIVGIEADDLRRIAEIKDVVLSSVDRHVDAFFDYLSRLGEARRLFAHRELVERARRLKREHLVAMVQGDYGRDYVEQRVELAALYSKGGIESRVFLGAFHHLLKGIGLDVHGRFSSDPTEAFLDFMSLEKIAFFDIGIIVDVIVHDRERIIRQQQEAIRELSTPVLQIRDRMLLLPIIGVLDTHRARLLTDNLLRAIRANRAKVVVMDVTGVVTIDSKVANHILQSVTAARLMGASVIITGLSAEVAQSLVAIGIELEKLNTVGDLQGGIEEAERALGYRIVRGDAATDAQARPQQGAA
jgi:rsbT co-antagonist protein RsbR